MKNKISLNQILGIVIFIFVFTVPISLYFYFTTPTEEKVKQNYIEKEKVENINDYEPVAISNERLGTIYYTEFYNLLAINSKEAYNKLSEKAKKKFESYDDFLNFSKAIPYSPVIKNIVVLEDDKYTTYHVYEQNGNTISFQATAINEYIIDID